MSEKRTYEVYRAEELEEEALEKAKEQVNCDFPWMQEAVDSLEKFTKALGQELVDYEIDVDLNRSNVRFSRRETEWKIVDYSETGVNEVCREELKTNLENIRDEYELTGVFYDGILAVGALNVIEKAETMRDVMEEATWELFKAIQDEHEYMSEDDVFFETCEANDFWFTKDGKLN